MGDVLISPKIIHDHSHEFRYYYHWDVFWCVICSVWLDPCDCKPEDNCPFAGRPDVPDDSEWIVAKYEGD